MVALYVKITVASEAKKRRIAGGSKGGKARAKMPEPSSPEHRARDGAAKVVGTSARSAFPEKARAHTALGPKAQLLHTSQHFRVLFHDTFSNHGKESEVRLRYKLAHLSTLKE